MTHYEICLSIKAVFKLKKLPRKKQFSILAYLTYLQTDPFDEGCECFFDEHRGRYFHIKKIHQYLIFSYSDHAIK